MLLVVTMVVGAVEMEVEEREDEVKEEEGVDRAGDVGIAPLLIMAMLMMVSLIRSVVKEPEDVGIEAAEAGEAEDELMVIALGVMKDTSVAMALEEAMKPRSVTELAGPTGELKVMRPR